MNTAIVILAAGASNRFQGCKLLEQRNGFSLLKRIVLEAEAAMPDHVYVVLGAHRHLLEPEAGPAKIIINANWQSGMGSSISIAVKELRASYNAILIVLGDQVAIQAKHLEALVNVYKNKKSDLVCSRFNGTLGPPALFAGEKLKMLQALQGDKGAKQLLDNENPIAIDLPVAGIDIDTRSHLAEYGNQIIQR